MKVTWESILSRSCLAWAPLARPGWSSPLPVAGHLLTTVDHHVKGEVCWNTDHVSLNLLDVFDRCYVMKELMSEGWDSEEKDKNITEVCGEILKEARMLWLCALTLTLPFSGQHPVQFQASQYHQVKIHQLLFFCKVCHHD